MTEEDKFNLVSTAGFLAAFVGFFLQLWWPIGKHLLVVAPLALLGIGASLYAIGAFPGIVKKGVRVWLSVLVGIIVLWTGISDALITRAVNTAFLESLDADTRAVLVALEAYRAERGMCPDRLDDLSPEFLSTSIALTAPDGSPAYAYVLSSDKKTCSIPIPVK